MFNRLILVIFTLLLLPCVANAEFSLAEYRKFSQAPEVKARIGEYVTGVGNGIFYANIMLELEKKTPLFCSPRKLAIDAGIIQSLLNQEIMTDRKSVVVIERETV